MFHSFPFALWSIIAAELLVAILIAPKYHLRHFMQTQKCFCVNTPKMEARCARRKPHHAETFPCKQGLNFWLQYSSFRIEGERIQLDVWNSSLRFLLQVTYVFMQDCRVDFLQNTMQYNSNFQWLTTERSKASHGLPCRIPYCRLHVHLHSANKVTKVSGKLTTVVSQRTRLLARSKV